MKGMFALLFMALPACILASSLDYQCGSTVSVSYGSYTETFYPVSSSQYYSDCRIKFSTTSYSYKETLTIKGNSLVPSQCAVNVFGSSDLISKTGGPISESVYFTRTINSDSTGDLYLHVQGSGCTLFGLSFTITAQETCPSYKFQCDNGQCVYNSDRCDGYWDCTDGSDEDDCVWGVGKYVGVSVGVFFFFIFVVVLSTVCYRRRYVYRRGPIIVAPNGHTFMTSTSHVQASAPTMYPPPVTAMAPPPYSAVVGGQTTTTSVAQSRW